MQVSLTTAQAAALKVAADYYANALPSPRGFTETLRQAAMALDTAMHVNHVFTAARSTRRWLQQLAA